jgi:hypothetical protein
LRYPLLKLPGFIYHRRIAISNGRPGPREAFFYKLSVPLVRPAAHRADVQMDEILPRIVADAADLHSQCSLARLIDGQSIEAQIDGLSDNVAAFLRRMAVLLAQFSIRSDRSISAEDLERSAISRMPFECMQQIEQSDVDLANVIGVAVAEQMVDLRQSVWQVLTAIEERSDKVLIAPGRMQGDNSSRRLCSQRNVRSEDQVCACSSGKEKKAPSPK